MVSNGGHWYCHECHTMGYATGCGLLLCKSPGAVCQERPRVMIINRCAVLCHFKPVIGLLENGALHKLAVQFLLKIVQGSQVGWSKPLTQWLLWRLLINPSLMPHWVLHYHFHIDVSMYNWKQVCPGVSKGICSSLNGSRLHVDGLRASCNPSNNRSIARVTIHEEFVRL